MKKLLALVLVIGLASLSSAAYVLNVAGAAPNYTLSISTAAGDPYIGLYGVSATNAVVSGGVVGPAAESFGPQAPEAMGEGIFGVINGLNATTNAGIQVQNIMWNIKPGFSQSTASLFQLNDQTGEPIGQAWATVTIPEPMTLSLLALGGLGLIRRRRA